LIHVLRCYVAAEKFQLHDFVIMPNHVHLLIAVTGDGTIEKAMQLIKGDSRIARRKNWGIWERSGRAGFPN